MNVKLQKDFRELEPLIELKILEFLGDPDESLSFRKSFLTKLKKRLKSQSKTISQADILKKYDVV